MSNIIVLPLKKNAMLICNICFICLSDMRENYLSGSQEYFILYIIFKLRNSENILQG